MYKGGPNYTPQAARIIRYAGLIVPVLLLIYGNLVALGVAPSASFINMSWLHAITVIWLTLGMYQFFVPSKSNLESACRIIAYHILAAVYIITIVGLQSPVAILWILLLIASNVYLSRLGIWFSLLVFIALVGIDVFLLYESDILIVVYDMFALIAILTAGLVVISVSRSQEANRLELDRSRELEALQRDRILTIVNNLADAILSTDREGIIRVYNAASLNLLDTNDSLNGHHIDEIVPLIDTSGQTVALFDLLQEAKTVVLRDDLRYTFDDGEQIRLEVTLSPIRNSFHRADTIPGHDGYIVIMRDITKAKSLEEERDEFISVVSHELRTPITIAEGTLANAQIMATRSDIDSKTLTASIDTAHEQIIFLAKIVNDLSTLSRAERGIADSKEVIDVKQLAHRLYEMYEGQASEKGLQLNLDLGSHLGSVIASRLYLEELLQNFVTNAIKYTKKGSVTLSVKQKREHVTFSVKDSGIGISKSDQVKIFDKFYRSEDYRTRETGGTGLGLYVAVKLARKLDTDIELASRLNHGSTFQFTLPVIKEVKSDT